MNKKLAKKSNRGRKPNRAVLSGSKPGQETFDEFRCKFYWGSPEWRMVALQNLIKNGSQLPSNYLSASSDVRCSPYAQRPAGVYPFWNRLCYEFERAVVNRDADWFRRQADAIEKGGQPSKRAQFYALVTYLVDSAVCATQGRPENWRLLTGAEREAFRKMFPNLPPRVPHVDTLTPAGKITDATASDIWKEVIAFTLEEPVTRSLIEQQLEPGQSFGFKTKINAALFCKTEKQKRQIVEQVVAESYGFKIKEHAMDAIRDLADLLQVELKKQGRKTTKPQGNAAAQRSPAAQSA